jgi:D-glycero-D-manno-heptose 1,7-bisphosphate phosphatase
MPLARAVFFDRDGTLMHEVNYCSDPAKVVVYPGVPDALARLKAAGFHLFVITNQAGIGRGIMTAADYYAVEREFLRQLGPALIDASFFCPDHPRTPSTRRKPEPGMVLEAAARFDIDLPNSFFVGDKAIDIECGRRAGTRTIRVLTGYGSEQDGGPDLVVADAVAAADAILELQF